jgi:hypothetical protein
MMSGNGTSKTKIAKKAAAAIPTMIRFLQGLAADPHHGLQHDREHRRLQPEEQRRHDANLAEGGVD